MVLLRFPSSSLSVFFSFYFILFLISNLFGSITSKLLHQVSEKYVNNLKWVSQTTFSFYSSASSSIHCSTSFFGLVQHKAITSLIHKGAPQPSYQVETDTHHMWNEIDTLCFCYHSFHSTQHALLLIFLNPNKSPFALFSMYSSDDAGLFELLAVGVFSVHFNLPFVLHKSYYLMCIVMFRNKISFGNISTTVNRSIYLFSIRRFGLDFTFSQVWL